MKKHQLFILSSGEYSDYQILGLFLTLKEVDIKKVSAEFREYRIKYPFVSFEHYIVNIAKIVREIHFRELWEPWNNDSTN